MGLNSFKCSELRKSVDLDGDNVKLTLIIPYDGQEYVGTARTFRRSRGSGS